MRRTPTNLDIDALLASAKAAERAGLVAQAINRYRDAFTLIARTGLKTPAETFSRLPTMLANAGLKNEAWYEYTLLLVAGCPGRQAEDLPALWNDRAALFDKMRSFLQHENEHTTAAICAVLFYVCRVVSCNYQPQVCNPKAMRSLKTTRSLLIPLLRRAKNIDALPWLASELQTLVRTAPADIVERAAISVAQALSAEGNANDALCGRFPLPPLHNFRATPPTSAPKYVAPMTI